MMAKLIEKFTGQYRFLSNFWICDIFFVPAHLDCNEMFHAISVEHAFQAMKAASVEDVRSVLACETPGDAKHKGKEIKLRSGWDKIKNAEMEALLYKKFQIPELKMSLMLTTGAELIEGNSWGDTYWGVCAGIGQNNLGKLLMKIRDKVIKEYKESRYVG
jgi:ribA/ribD-fused uncharacterized protein